MLASYDLSEPSSIESSGIDAEAFQLVLATHRRHAHEAGYRRAIADVLAAAVFTAEKSLRTARDPADTRHVLYRFLELLEQETTSLAAADNTVSDGLGI